MTEEQIQRAVQSIGKRTMRNCYEIAKKKGLALTIEDLILEDVSLAETKDSGLSWRLSSLKKLIKNNKLDEAYKIALEAKRGWN